MQPVSSLQVVQLAEYLLRLHSTMQLLQWPG